MKEKIPAIGEIEESNLREDQKERIKAKITEIFTVCKNIAISGEVGVGKIIRTLDALREVADVYYVGNPVDFAGVPRPQGYDKYLAYIISLKKDMHIVADEKEFLSLDFLSLPPSSIVVIDEIYGRSVQEYKKISSLLDMASLKVVLITGCLKNLGGMIRKFQRALMFTLDGVIVLDREFAEKICAILGDDPLKEQKGLFH